jgi:hypothetical protein
MSRNKELTKINNRSQYQKHREKIRAKAKAKYNLEKLNRTISHYFLVKDKWRFLSKLKALQKVSGLLVPKCCICGIEDPRVLTINHKNGDGKIDNKKYHSSTIAVNRGRDVSDLDVRCFNCNILYEFELGRRGPSNWKEYYDNVVMTKR